MDILRRELDAIYRAQGLEHEVLNADLLDDYRGKAEFMTVLSDEIVVITDASADTCFVYGGSLASLLGLSSESWFAATVRSSDEDLVYELMHPEDLADKRMLEYEFFKFVDKLSVADKLSYVAMCRIRMRNRAGKYVYIENSTEVLDTARGGGIWLILCRYRLSSEQDSAGVGIRATIVNKKTGDAQRVSFDGQRHNILSPREKEIIGLIKTGLASKQIADRLGISINTVNRHRQNIIEKLSVRNSVEAVAAATAMRLL